MNTIVTKSMASPFITGFVGAIIIATLLFGASFLLPKSAPVTNDTTAEVVLPEPKPAEEQKSEEPAQRAEADTIKKGVPLLQGNEIKWQVPEGTTSVIVQIQERNGRLINEYEISRFITIQPGQRLRVLAK